MTEGKLVQDPGMPDATVRQGSGKGRSRWLESGTLRTRTSQPEKTARFDFRDQTSRVLVAFDPKGPGRTTAYIEHARLPNAKAVETQRAFWKARLTRLAEVLSSSR